MEKLTVKQLGDLCRKNNIKSQRSWRKKDYIFALKQKNVKPEHSSKNESLYKHRAEESSVIDDLMRSIFYLDYFVYKNFRKPVAQKIQKNIIQPLREQHPELFRQFSTEQRIQFLRGMKEKDNPFGQLEPFALALKAN